MNCFKGWYEGEHMRDLQQGSFPSNFTVEIADEHTVCMGKNSSWMLPTSINISEVNKIINNGDENDQ